MQIVTNAPLLEGRVLASVFGATEEEAIAAAMAKAGVTELIPLEKALRSHPRPEKLCTGVSGASLPLFDRMQPPPATGISAALVRYRFEVERLTDAIGTLLHGHDAHAC